MDGNASRLRHPREGVPSRIPAARGGYLVALGQHAERIQDADQHADRQRLVDQLRRQEEEISKNLRQGNPGSPYLNPTIGARARSATVKIMPRETHV